MVYKRIRSLTSGRSLPSENFVEYHPPPPGFDLTMAKAFDSVNERSVSAMAAHRGTPL